MRTIFSLIGIIISIETGITQNLEIYDGSIDKLPISVFLNINNSDVTGCYLYKNHGQPIPLEGTIKNGKFTMTEFSPGNGKRDRVEAAKLTWNRNNTSSGQWISKSKSLSLNLNKRKLPFSWNLFDIKVTLTHTIVNNKVHEYPVTLKMIYPEAEENWPLFNSLLPDIFGLKPEYDNILEYFNTFLRGIYEFYLNDFPSSNAPDHYYEMNGKVIFLSESVLSYQVSGYAFSGGAHGQPIEDYYVYNLKQGARIAFDDVFKSNSELPIARIIHEKDNRQHNIKEIAENLYNFYLTDKGIGFIFNPYDIDCYGCGTFEFFLNFDEIRDLLK